MLINGVEVSDLAIEREIIARDVVPGRVLQLDADQICYTAGCYDDEPFASAKQNFKTQVEAWRMLAGAEFVNLHMTGANKGGRFDTAMVKEYQANRKDKIKPRHLQALRAWVLETYSEHPVLCAVLHEDQEADDGMCQGNYKANAKELSVICSGDKDLRMCSGLHLDQRSGDIVDVQGYGYIELVQASTKQIKGYGTAFFWAQLLMGDTADNIPGLPALGPDTLVQYPEFHTAALTKLLDQCMNPDEGKADIAAAKISCMPHKKVGAVGAYTILKDCKDNRSALLAVLQAYKGHYGMQEFDFVDWRGNTVRATAGTMLVEQAELLWMRRTREDRGVDFLTEVKRSQD